VPLSCVTSARRIFRSVTIS